MLQNNNAAREIVYIFLWLLGIILFYALVHTFLLEPSSGKSEHVKHVETTSNTVDTVHNKKTKIEDSAIDAHTVKAETKPPVKLVPTEHSEVDKPTLLMPIATKPVHVKYIPPKQVKPIEPVLTKVSVPVKPIAIPAQIKKVSTKDVEIQKIPKVEIAVTTLSIPALPSVPKVPTTSKIPTVSTPLPVIRVPQVKHIPVAKSKTIVIEKKSEVTIESKEVSKIMREIVSKEVNSTYDRDKNMRLLETARQHIIEKAEAAREAAMKGLAR